MKRWLRVGAGVGILVALASVVGADAFAAGLAALTPATAATALVVGLATTVLGALRWRLVAGRVGLALSLPTAVVEYYRAGFLNTVLPGGVLGDLDRAVRHGLAAEDVARSARVVVLERTAGLLVLVVAAIAVLPAQAVAGGIVDALAVAAAIVAALGLSVAVVLARTERGRRAIRMTVADLRAGVLARDTWPALLGLSAAALAGHVALFVVAARAAGVDAPLLELTPLLLVALLAMALPVGVGGFGPREGAAALAFAGAGLGAAAGVATAVAYGVLTLVSVLPGTVALARRGRSGRRQVQLEQDILAEDEPAHRAS